MTRRDDESANISTKSFFRAIESVNKVGYMDGASQGQIATFQPSFNIGYEQGLNFGLHLGFKEANLRIQDQQFHLQELTDSRRINCQICLNNVTMKENIVNLCNTQKEKNDEIISLYKQM
ncbi:uncharacterized protein LOC113519671 [Galleria mellonella]|uniref:Uncharacterized protein LOC113519671 n=1 Tax=Galleria mellonella TaxID=7137 RepID=A0A6J3CB04_GALME|nr:uncharacterized protein LOC113519671 [Galleria mellonella]XP_026760630.1 uncharacterized protein LOC113519671 [Galleria mellonella]XP_031768995.1 uncharacterized protein LOC113519671 [Galleria mellonella]